MALFTSNANVAATTSTSPSTRPSLPPLHTLNLPRPDASRRAASPASSASSHESYDSPMTPFNPYHPRHRHRMPSTSSTSSTPSRLASLSPPPYISHAPSTTRASSKLSSPSPSSITGPEAPERILRLRPVRTLAEADAAIVIPAPDTPFIPSLPPVDVLSSPSTSPSSASPTSLKSGPTLTAPSSSITSIARRTSVSSSPTKPGVRSGTGNGTGNGQVLLLVREGMRHLKGPDRRLTHGARVHPYRIEWVSPDASPASRRGSMAS
ncbi:hypothetical protein PUNSTDRAFT_135005 [Punctularia strigosozonata HHB-11173 SS5]|uniref:uncharacterized protein n=1 Tax=Punctularia strigosozonata (strain HHB-11173) TaxID=741275 RepID=UPI0004418720|nr:uncharacterized protein PUNSTDRAFT_135005 [Punctularia strigosozonata HHB-11173 SS5]EIN08630.1 hypothetical protein PUNSTDRAFT_135005 [Punctularia strigosozonata HHB-11173 SS5]